jgi:VanZ family protein
VAWLLVLAWAAVIFTFSTDTFSSEHTQGVVLGILHVMIPRASENTLLTLHTLLRKCSHVGEYFIFGLLLFRAVRAPEHGWQWRWAFLAMLIAALYASSDEMHQIFVPSRGASVWDALLDTGGASVAQLVAWIVNGRGQSAEQQIPCVKIGRAE